MKIKDWLILGFFGSLWGTSEAILGGALYAVHIPHASTYLTIIAFCILAMARAYLPKCGTSILIGSIAALFKMINVPFYGCHLLAIFLLGVAFDAVLTLAERNKSSSTFAREGLQAVAATYLGYALFGFIITYVVKYHWWAQVGLPKVARYIGISGTMTAIGTFFLVPLSFKLGNVLKNKKYGFGKVKLACSTSALGALTAILWIMGILIKF